VDGEEVVGGFGASFGGWRLEEVVHTAVILGRRRMVAQWCVRWQPTERSGGSEQTQAAQSSSARWEKAESVVLRSTSRRSIAQG
jgi:hypothetical protein